MTQTPTNTPALAVGTTVKRLIWTLGDDEITAEALGVKRFYRIYGQPGRWELIYPYDAAMRYDGPFETQMQARKAAQAEYERRILSAVEQSADSPTSIQAAAHTLLDVWEAGIGGKAVSEADWRSVVTAISFGAASYDLTPMADAKPGGMIRAFLQAVIDPAAPELDWLRANAAERDDPVVETICLYEGDNAVVMRDPPGNITTYGPKAHLLMDAIMARIGQNDEPASANHPIEHIHKSEQGAG